MIITEFGLESNGRVTPVNGVRTLRELAIYLITHYLRNEGVKYKDTAEWIMELVDSDDAELSYYEATPMLGYFIWNSYTVLKNKGTAKLNNHQRKQVPFIIGKILAQNLTEYAQR